MSVSVEPPIIFGRAKNETVLRLCSFSMKVNNMKIFNPFIDSHAVTHSIVITSKLNR
jgi:hypothetical protein